MGTKARLGVETMQRATAVTWLLLKPSSGTVLPAPSPTQYARAGGGRRNEVGRGEDAANGCLSSSRASGDPHFLYAAKNTCFSEPPEFEMDHNDFSFSSVLVFAFIYFRAAILICK